MYYALLSGGSGKRLWPLSNDARPKQYVKLVNQETNSMERCSMLQRVWAQLLDAKIANNTIITAGEAQAELIQSQVPGAQMAAEPAGRDTFGAVLLSCAYLHSCMGASKEDYVAVMPIDPYTERAYFEAVKGLEKVMKDSGADAGLMGAVPSYPATKYGYILPGEQKEGYFWIQSFIEKPEERQAEELLGQGALWNCGVFCLRIGDMLERAKVYGVPEDYEGLYAAYEKLPRISFDYEVLEKSEKLAAVEFQGYWKDLGTWDAMAEQMSMDTFGKVILDDTCRNTQVINELAMPVVTVGTRNLVVVAAQDGILVADKNETGRVKELTAGLQTRPMFEERRWGTLETLDDTETAQISTLTRKIRIYDGMTSSYHYHKDRDEIWTVLKGTGELILEGNKIALSQGKAVCIRKNQRHAVKAFKDFEYIEIHVGTSVGNDDIHRITFEWDEIERSSIL
ncbi:MAG: cupin domain-containing protein [Lachnospiraceae bacterium]|jgi:mannose-1-phosphate guanylyltransferase|uniref:sugar phosphate nucleotidyltransferase n=1 Tax=Candidatus Merdisoma sp. JLR.KK006 TaxID=3112626 RepID=UPI002FF0370D|nr:cupin domain-containing protein [Lachnospiraceae bacterium]